MTPPARFDRLSGSYEDLLRDPIRDRFAGENAAYFHLRKARLIRDYFQRRSIDTQAFSYLDVGCGKGELLGLLRDSFLCSAGCDVSAEMMRAIPGIETRVQQDSVQIPFGDSTVDFVTAVCVYHHVPPQTRPALTLEMHRVLKPGGICAIIEHNPLNPVTRLIVSRTPIDDDAILLRADETRRLMQTAGFAIDEEQYFLYFPEKIYAALPVLEHCLRKIPAGGQYAVFGVKPSSSARQTGR